MNNNYTTTEQSDRLINAGMPASSADCYFYTKVDKQPKILTSDKFDWLESPYIPCWSVGRLIEILMICNTYLAPKEFKIEPNSMKPTLIENVVNKIEELEGYDMLDFSKLED